MGRTARGGSRGFSISMISPEVLDKLQNIEESISDKLIEFPFPKEDEVLQNKNKIDKIKRKVKVHFYAKGFDQKFDQMKKKKIKFTEKVKKLFSDEK